MKAYRFLLLLTVPLFMAACSVQEEPGTDDEIATRAENAKGAPSTGAKKDDKVKDDIDDTLGGIKAGSGARDKSSSDEKEMSDYEKRSLEMQQKQLDSQNQDRELARERHQSIMKLEQDNLQMSQLMAYGMFAIASQLTDLVAASAVTVRPDVPEECEDSAVGTRSRDNNVQRFMDMLEKRLQANMGEDFAPAEDEAASSRAAEETNEAEANPEAGSNTSGNTEAANQAGAAAPAGEVEQMGPPAPEANAGADLVGPPADVANWHPPMQLPEGFQNSNTNTAPEWHPPMQLLNANDSNS